MFQMVGPTSIDWRNIFDRFYWRGIGGLVDRKRTLLPNWCLVYSTDAKETKKRKKLNWKRNYQRTTSSEKITEEHLKMIWWYVVWRRESLLVIRQVIGDFDLYLIFVIFFTQSKFLENKIYTKKTRKLRQNTQ